MIGAWQQSQFGFYCDYSFGEKRLSNVYSLCED